MLFFYFLFAHLVSDYILQPDNLVEWKSRSKWGVFMHVIIHFLFTTLVLFLYTGHLQVAALALLVAIFHFTIDSAKAAHDQRSENTLISYWFDQAAHYLSLLLVTLLSFQFNGIFAARTHIYSNYFDLLFFNPVIITFLSLAIFMTLGIEYSHYKQRGKYTNAHPLLNRRNMIRRLFLASIIYFGLLFALVPSVGINFLS